MIQRGRLVLVVAVLLPAFLVTVGERASEARSTTTALSPPTLVIPAEGETLTSFGTTLTWTNPPGASQVHLQLIPFNNDGPGGDVHLDSAATSYRIPPPPEWYGLLPDMTYTWRVRASDASAFVGLDDPSWSPWAVRTFRTPAVSSATISLVSPALGAIVTRLTPMLRWGNSRSDVFYYELQVSRDPDFGSGLFGSWAPVHGELAHGGRSDPPNSYEVPAAFPLQDNASYYWRVRPRLQGDGTPVQWSFTFNFETVTAAGLPPPTPTATPVPPGPGRIAFASDRDRNWEIYVMEQDGSRQSNLTRRAGADFGASWSPDARKIAFASDRLGDEDIFVMNADGSDVAPLTTDKAADWGPSWSPKGAGIAFTTKRDGNNEIYVMDADGSNQKRLTNNPANDELPSWSPDGTHLVFRSDRDGNYEIYRIDVQTGVEARLTNNKADDYDPVYSPDGSKIAFSSLRDGNEEIYVMNADGTGQTRLTDSAGTDEVPTWSPDGKKLAFDSNRTGFYAIYTMNADGSGISRLTNTRGNDRFPNWARK